MTTTHAAGTSGRNPSFARRMVAAASFVLALAATGGAAQAASPPAGTPIGNQATATYLDATSTSRTVTSNLVTTIVQQVASFTLTADGARTSAPGGQAVFPHTLTNTGNGTDTFPLTLVNLGGDDFDLTGLSIYADADGNGIPDNFTPVTTTGPLAAGGTFRFVVVGNVPGTQLAADVARARISAASTFDGTQTAFNTDVVTVTGNAVIAVTKAISQSSGASPSGPYTYTLTYTNSGNSTATNVTLSDALPAGLTYVGNSGRWSTTGATVLTDANNADAQGTAPNTVIYDFGVTAAGTVTAKINRVAPGSSGTVTFQVNVNTGLAPQVINNLATFTYNDGVSNVGPFNTNQASFTVTASAALTFTGQTVASALQGGTVAFTNTLTNTGNSSDVFDIVVGASTFPAGSSYTLYKSDGVTPLTDSNANGVPDTGPLAAGASTSVILKVTLPPSATGGPYNVSKTATSANDPTKSATASDVLTAIVSNTVDLTNTSALPGAPGAGAGPEAAAVVTTATNPNATVRFTLYVNNTSTQSDDYDLTASTVSSFASLTLPAGWTATFKDAGNGVITNTGSIAAGGNKLVYVDVTVPAGYAAGQVEIYFRTKSPNTGALDRIHDAVSVNVVRSLTLVPNNSAQVAPGGTVVYSHLLVNAGNVVEGTGTGSFTSITAGNDQAGWTAGVFYDSNGNGVFDAGDAPLTDLSGQGGIAPGATVRVFVQVFSPAGAPLGQVNTTSVTVHTTNGSYVVAPPSDAIATDVSTVINGQLQLVKHQALDANCDGVEDGPFGVLNITAGAIPGACLRYELVVTNVGTSSVSNVLVSDATPANTTYSSAAAATTTQGSIVTPANGATGTITASVGTLAPGQSVTIHFGVRINP